VVLHCLDARALADEQACAGVPQVMDPQPAGRPAARAVRVDSLISRTHQYAHNRLRLPTSSSHRWLPRCMPCWSLDPVGYRAICRRSKGERAVTIAIFTMGGYAKEGARGAYNHVPTKSAACSSGSRWKSPLATVS
jgi:hypothetical protein